MCCYASIIRGGIAKAFIYIININCLNLSLVIGLHFSGVKLSCDTKNLSIMESTCSKYKEISMAAIEKRETTTEI